MLAVSGVRERGCVTLDGDLWVFGYGSLVWRPEFAHTERRPAYVVGWARRFWQGSTDHRGLPHAPGRVVTLVPAPEARCAGMAYRLAPPQQPDALAKLDHRERGGYVRESVNLEFGEASSGVVRAVMYRATPRNPNYLGPAPLERIAQQVRASHGPSGSNSEYVLRLAEALRVLGAEDEHVFALEALLRASGDGGDVARGSSARA